MGKVTVNIRDEGRLEAILVLSRAIEKLAAALVATPSVSLADCTFTSKDGGAGVTINNAIVSELRQETIVIENDEAAEEP